MEDDIFLYVCGSVLRCMKMYENEQENGLDERTAGPYLLYLPLHYSRISAATLMECLSVTIVVLKCQAPHVNGLTTHGKNRVERMGLVNRLLRCLPCVEPPAARRG